MKRLFLALGLLGWGLSAAAVDVKITPELPTVEVLHQGKVVTIQRNQNKNNTINPDYAKTSRECPPFCVQVGTIAPGVETIGELEVIEVLKKIKNGEKTHLVIDSRTEDWVKKGTIPGAVNIPWTKLNIGQSDPITVQEILEKQLGVVQRDGFFDFSQAKSLVLFCNGPWCGQSPNNIKGLLKIGYPANKIKWYRGGMQDWESLGLTTVK